MIESRANKRHLLTLAFFVVTNFAPVAHADSPNVVISQVYGGGGNTGAIYKNDFIELFNRGSSVVNLNGWSVQYASSSGTSWQKTNLTNITLQPGQYYLVQEAAGTTGMTNLPAVDGTGTIPMSSSTGKVALVSNQALLTGSCPTAGIVDFVGYGAANCSEAAPIGALSNTNSAVRAENGCIDTDNNSSNFAIGVPNPRNTGAALNSCNIPTAPIVNLSVSTNAGNEAGATVITVSAIASTSVIGNQTVNVVVSGSGITVGDYALSNTTITIPNGASMGSVSFSVVNDTLEEGTETAMIAMSSPSAGIKLGSMIFQSIVITDDDNTSGGACGAPASKISSIQGGGAATTFSGLTSIEAIVIGDYQGSNGLGGFFVQEEDNDGDANPATSEGIFVFEGSTSLADVNIGDRVRVTGTPGENFGTTQLSAAAVQVCDIQQTIPTPSSLTLPVPNVPNGNLAKATAAINNYYEPFEGMLVKFPATLKVTEYFELERYGQLVLSQGGRMPAFTSISNPDTTGLINHEIKLAKRKIILDDGNDKQNFYITPYAVSNYIPLPYPTGGLSTTHYLRGGDTISNLTGVLQYAFGQWRVRPVNELVDYSFTPANPRKAVMPVVGGRLKVASFNVLNYFTTIDTTSSSTSGACNGGQDCRGADSTAELTRQTAKAASAICGIKADILGLMEIENNATASLNSLVNAVNAISGCGPYAYINTGIIGTDAIKVGLLYKTSTVLPFGSHAVLTTGVDARFIDDKNRPALAQTFVQIANGEKLTIAVNHLKSKGSACTDIGDPDLNDGQGNCNQTRKDAALALVDWLNSDPTQSGDPDFLIIGDLNSYAKEDPVKAIEDGPDGVANTLDDYTNLVKVFAGTKAYSYIFAGQTGYLDHALASHTLLQHVRGTANWHINADEMPSFDYNDTVKDSGEAAFEARSPVLPLYAADQYRSSDHDPVIIGLDLSESINILDGTSTRNILRGTAGKERITGLGGADTLTGGANADAFVYLEITDGIDTITDFTLGEDKIVLTALLQNIEYQGANPLAERIVKFAASGSNTIVYIDIDGTGPAPKRALIMINNVSVAKLGKAANFIF